MEREDELTDSDRDSFELATRWCSGRGQRWEVVNAVGRGGTAPVYLIKTPAGDRALKILDRNFCEGDLGQVTEKRIAQQVELGDHECPYLVKIYEGGSFEDRLYLLMSRAPGQELEKRLADVPRNKIRQIMDQIARACIFLRNKGLCHRDIKSPNIFISDDFEHATLLDLSVTRTINDPVGAGTDHDGQLPVVATARYSPPEYLFRLIEPSAELWHGLDVYQMGGLLHDLIMREPLFQNEHRLSRENRYRFAWIVATVSPVVEAVDVDQDLVLLARRALDKDFDSRTKLQLEDFLCDAEAQRLQGLKAFGLSSAQRKKGDGSRAPTVHRRVATVAKSVETCVREFLRSQGVTASHEMSAGTSDASKRIEFKWQIPQDGINVVFDHATFRVELSLTLSSNAAMFNVITSLSAKTAAGVRETQIRLPNIPDNAETIDAVSKQAAAALGDLTRQLLQFEDKERED